MRLKVLLLLSLLKAKNNMDTRVLSAAIEKYIYFPDKVKMCDFIDDLTFNKVKFDVLESIPYKDGSYRVVIRHEFKDHAYFKGIW